MGATFVIIVLISGSHDWPVRLAGAAIGALAAPMIFEFPFDLIVMARTFPRIPDPALYRILFFAPLFLIEITTLSLLALSPMVRLSKATFFSFAAILAGFRGLGPVRVRLPFRPAPLRAERAVEDPGVRYRAQPVPAAASRSQRIAPATGPGSTLTCTGRVGGQVPLPRQARRASPRRTASAGSGSPGHAPQAPTPATADQRDKPRIRRLMETHPNPPTAVKPEEAH